MFIYKQVFILHFLLLFNIFPSYLLRSSSSFFQNPYNKLDDLDSVDTIILSQSEVCSPTDDLKRIQCFRELPLPKYEVFEGEDVLMTCRVAYQKGKLQWAFKGKMLGFDRDIPNYPRMRMPGKIEIGDHSLFIERTKVSDSGEYECQLSPSLSQPPRRRLTNLLVLREPMQPTIYKEGVLTKENISVSIKKKETAFVINLTCKALNGNPSPTFEWKVNDNRLEPTSTFRFGKIKIAMINESASLLSIKSDQISNNDVIKCGVFNNATRKRDETSERILTTQVRVFKRILPGPLQFKELLPNSNTITINEKETLRLSCITNDPGEPSVKLIWTSDFQKDSITEDMITNVQSNFFTQSSIVLPDINSKWHQKKITCTGLQDNLPVTSSIQTLILVKHIPDKVEMSAVSLVSNYTIINPSIIYFKENEMVRLVCKTNTFYSQNINIIWFTKVSEDSKWRQDTRSIEKVIKMNNGNLKVMKSTLDISPIVVDRSLYGKESSKIFLYVSCIMKSSELNRELRKQVRLEAYERPSIPILTINDERKSPVLTNGQSVKIKCSVSGGYPTPELHLVDEREHEIIARKYFQLSMMILEYNIEIKQRDNGKKFRCLTTSKGSLDSVSLSSDLITLRVAIPPSKLSMKLPLSKFGFRAHQYVSYNCFTDTSFPQAKIEWWLYHSCKLQHIKLSKINRLSASNIKPFCESEIIEDHQVANFDPLTQSTNSILNIKLLPSHDQTFIECAVAPFLQWTTFLNNLSKISQLRVQYLPQFPTQLEKMYTVEEGQNLSIAINASSNPTINGYTWLVNKQAITRKSQIELKVDKFAVVNAQHDMMGNYTLLLENPIGKASLSFFLNITFAPKLLGPTVETTRINPLTEYKQKAVIMCSAQANPFREQVKVQWIREPPLIMDHNDLLDILKGHSFFASSPPVHCNKDQWTKSNVSINCISLGAIEIVSSLQILPIDYRYIGSYKCIFSSYIKPSSAVKTTHLLFSSPPIPVNNFRKSEYAAKIGGKTEIACYFVAFPDPTIVWLRSPNLRCSDNSKKYAISISTPQTGLIKAVLAIRDTNDSDVGTYICNAQNQYGKSSHSVHLGMSRSPTQPFNVTIVNTSDTSITLGWITGFNGGSKQTIELRWRLYDVNRDVEYSFMEFGENDDNDIQFYTINDLQNHKEYEVLIQAINRYSVTPHNPIQLFVKTMKYDFENELVQSDGSKAPKGHKGKNIQDKSDTNNILIIILLSTIGGLLVGLKIGLLTYFLRRRTLKHRKSMDKMSSPTSQRMTDGYPNSADSMEMRAPSLVRSGIDSNMYAQSISDHMSQNGSDNGLKLNYYKTTSDEFQTQYLSPELDLVASAMGRNNFNINGMPSNFHPAYIQLAESSSLTGYPEPYLTGYYTHKPIYHNQTPSRVITNNPNHSSVDTNILPQYPIATNYQKRVEINNYPSSAVSMSTASGDSNHSRSPHRKYIGYSPLVGQSGPASTVEEYLSSANSGSEYHRFASSGQEEYVNNPVSSFRSNQRDYYNGTVQDQISTQESILELPSHKMCGMDFHYSMVGDRTNLSTPSETEQLLKPPLKFASSSKTLAKDSSKLNYVDLISHSSPSVIRITGTISENL